MQTMTRATDLKRLSALDTALTQGDIPTLRSLLELLPSDLQAASAAVDEDADYDPFSTAPGSEQAGPANKNSADAESAADLLAKEAAEAEPPSKKRKKEKKEKKANKNNQNKSLAWSMEWAWLMNRTVRHADFRQAPVLPESKWAEAVPADAKVNRRLLVAFATSVIYTGDPTSGYDP